MKKIHKSLQIYNLEFPSHIDEIRVANYNFKRIKNYKNALSGMMHLVNSSGGEFSTSTNEGSHQITSTVLIPEKEEPGVLPFGNKKFNQLDDILFLLTIFTDRNVFKQDWKDEKNTIIIADHRTHHYGGQLACSIPYESGWKDRKTGELKNDDQPLDVSILNYYRVNIGFEKSINRVLNTISDKKWQTEYENGYFLLLFKAAIQRQIIETTFISCWTIWEHIFAVKNRKWLDTTTIEQMSADKKIAFILNEYFLKKIDETARKNIKKINQTRNRLIHFGKKTDAINYKEMDMFIRLTEQLIATILGLSPSNIFNSFEALEIFLNPKNTGNQKENFKYS